MWVVADGFSDDVPELTSPDVGLAWNELGYAEVFGNLGTAVVSIGLVLAIVVVATTVIIGTHFASTGFDAISLMFGTSVAVSPIASHAASTVLVHPEAASSLRHSALTEDPEVLNLVQNFLREQSNVSRG